MKHLSIKRTGNLFGVISVVVFLLCASWGVLLTDPSLKELHLAIVRIAYPGFALGIWGILTGLVESFIYGWLFGAFLAWLCKKICVVEGNE